MIALTLLFSTVGPSVTGLVQANDIQLNQQQSENWNSLEQITFDESDLAFYNKRKRIDGKSKRAIIGTACFFYPNGRKEFGRLVASFSRDAQGFNCGRVWLDTN